MKKFFLIAFYFFMACFGVIQLFFWINRRKKLVFTYHNIIPDELFDHRCHLGVSHSESVFIKQIQFICKRFTDNKKTIRCLITFDDGYKNQLEIGAKILNQYHLPGIFFVSFSSLITGQTLAIDKLMMWLSYVPPGKYKLLNASLELHEENRNLVASFLYDKLLKNFELWNSLEKELNTAFSFDHLIIDPQLMRLRFKPLEIEDLNMLIQQGHLIAAHSWDHRPLSTLPLETQKEDFAACASLVEQYCNSWLYSYPFGGTQEVSILTAKLCEEFGFSAAYMNIPVSPSWSGVNANYILPRYYLPNESNKYLLDAKLSGFELFLKRILAIITTLCRGQFLRRRVFNNG